MKYSFFFITALAIVPALVQGHGRLVRPRTRDMNLNIRLDLQYAPVPLSGEFVCRNLPAQEPQVTLKAGQEFNIEMNFQAPHPGDCAIYISYDIAADDTSKNFFKIAEIPECNTRGDELIAIQVPDYLPSCKHCVMRWEWYAVQQVVNIEYYNQCVDVIIDGSADGSLPTPQVTIPGHLPVDAGEYRNAYDNSPQFIVGPPIATNNGRQPAVSQQKAPSAQAEPVQVTPAEPDSVAENENGNTRDRYSEPEYRSGSEQSAPVVSTTDQSSCVGEYQYCGSDFDSEEKSCCNPSFGCARINAYHSQCEPMPSGGAQGAAKAPSPSPASRSPSPSPASNTPNGSPVAKTPSQSSPAQASCVGEYQYCGSDFDTQEKSCCNPSFSCTRINPYHSQCEPSTEDAAARMVTSSSQSSSNPSPAPSGSPSRRNRRCKKKNYRPM